MSIHLPLPVALKKLFLFLNICLGNNIFCHSKALLSLSLGYPCGSLLMPRFLWILLLLP